MFITIITETYNKYLKHTKQHTANKINISLNKQYPNKLKAYTNTTRMQIARDTSL